MGLTSTSAEPPPYLPNPTRAVFWLDREGFLRPTEAIGTQKQALWASQRKPEVTLNDSRWLSEARRDHMQVSVNWEKPPKASGKASQKNLQI